MKRTALFLFLSLTVALSPFAMGKNDSFNYAVGICYTTPKSDADRAVIRAIIATLEENHVEALSYDTGAEGEGMQSRVETLLKDRHVYGIIMICDNAATASEITAKCAKVRVPIAILGQGPEDMESFPAIVVSYDENRGHERLMETAVSLCTPKKESIQPLLITPSPESTAFRKLLDKFNNARYRSQNDWKDPLILRPGATLQETKQIVTSFLKDHREVNLIILPGNSVESLRTPLLGLGKWLNSDDPIHVVIGCMDGSAAAVQYLSDGYIDLIGGRDVVREAESLVYPLMENIKNGGKQASLQVPVPGRIITRGDLSEKDKIAWDETVPLVPADQTAREAKKQKKVEEVPAGQ